MTSQTSGVRPHTTRQDRPGRGQVGAVSGEGEGGESEDPPPEEQLGVEEAFAEFLMSMGEEEARDSGFEDEWRRLQRGVGIDGAAM